jgi:hypothetical protein
MQTRNETRFVSTTGHCPGTGTTEEVTGTPIAESDADYSFETIILGNALTAAAEGTEGAEEEAEGASATDGEEEGSAAAPVFPVFTEDVVEGLRHCWDDLEVTKGRKSGLCLASKKKFFFEIKTIILPRQAQDMDKPEVETMAFFAIYI